MTSLIRPYQDFGAGIDPIVEVGRDDPVGPEEVVGSLSLDGDPVEVLAGLAREAVVADDVVVEAFNLALRDAKRNVLTWKKMAGFNIDPELWFKFEHGKLFLMSHLMDVYNFGLNSRVPY